MYSFVLLNYFRRVNSLEGLSDKLHSSSMFWCLAKFNMVEDSQLPGLFIKLLLTALVP